MTRTHEIRPDLDEGIDRKVLAQLRARFMALNEGRMARAVEGLTPRQQSVLTLLPLFFHVNHPLLPGYVSGSTPAGLSNFEPDAQALSEAQRLTRSFSYKPRHGKPPQPIHGLFLMGSLGTLAQADQSDMDVWVCHAPDLGENELVELRKKCQLLEAWALSMGAEAHFFLIEPSRFVLGERDTQLSSDDCGTTQHYLLLDEFYRTAIWLAGRTPIWWLVPVYEEIRYAQFTHTLISKRFIRADETLDLGHLARIPPGEFIGAGLWQLFKGIESPYKSLLKLLLTEVYASEHPNVQCLSLRFKRAVFANKMDLDELDPYVVVYRRIEEYLNARNEPERLELVRRALYLKVNRKLSAGQRTIGWQHLLLERLAREWGWDQRQLALLDSRSQWKVRQVASERRALVNELNYSYRFLTQFARTVTIVHRSEAFRAEPTASQEALANPKIKVLWKHEPRAFVGDGALQRLRVENLKTRDTVELPTDGVFIFIGMIPRTELLKGIVPLDPWGCVQTDESMQTGVPGLFAAGDIRAKPFRQITTAVADGTIAALAAQKYLRETPA